MGGNGLQERSKYLHLGVVRVSEGSNDPDMCEEGWLGDRSSQSLWMRII